LEHRATSAGRIRKLVQMLRKRRDLVRSLMIVESGAGARAPAPTARVHGVIRIGYGGPGPRNRGAAKVDEGDGS
jgi:hypothetical protein